MGGGYLVKELSPGTFHITAKTNFAQWRSYGTARSMWAKRADEACAGRPFEERDVKEYDYREMPDVLWNRYIVTVKEGLAVCQPAESVE